MHTPEEDYLSISGIQKFAFCQRQWALLQIEQQWNENLYTIEGRIFHERAHDAYRLERRGELLISRCMPIRSARLMANGQCDVVEFRQSEHGVTIWGQAGQYLPTPVEYKKGAPKIMDGDRLQLCAQAICLEEMLCCTIDCGCLYYGETRKREEVLLTPALREKVYALFAQMHALYNRQYTPKVKPHKGCRCCSLAEICLPSLCGKRSVQTYLLERLSEETS
ncbi:MAG: CRISPR-associated protein Cas4 [Clostridiales bacterium]|jgi:CRISPR-associated exonuclease Cas4|nr:CRISPR-associated protein Cas4 [Clostridiales bacterium]